MSGLSESAGAVVAAMPPSQLSQTSSTVIQSTQSSSASVPFLNSTAHNVPDHSDSHINPSSSALPLPSSNSSSSSSSSPSCSSSDSFSSPRSAALDTAMALGSLALSGASSAASLLNSALQPFLVSESPHVVDEFHHNFPVVLVHGFRILGPIDDPKRHFRGIPSLYKSKGLTVIVPALPAVDDIETRAKALGRALGILYPNGAPIEVPVAHSALSTAPPAVAASTLVSDTSKSEQILEDGSFVNVSGEYLDDVTAAEGKDDSGELSSPQVFLRGGVKLYIWSSTPFDLSRYQGKFNFIAHSMAGLDSRFLISLAPQRIASLHCISTPHWGSRVASLTVEQKMNFLKDKSDFVKQLVNMFYKGLHDLTREHMVQWNKKYSYGAPGSGYDIHKADVKIWSYSGSTRFGSAMSLVGMFEFDGSNPDINDGVVTFYASKWGHFLRQLPLDHLEQVGLNTHVSAPFTGKYEDHFRLYEDIANRLEEWRLVPRLQESTACNIM